jgi:hypothetical protein
LTVTMSLGSITAEATSAKRSSNAVTWQPPERRELLWDCQERWLWCRVHDGSELGLSTLAGEGRVDLRAFYEANNTEVVVDLFASGGEDSDDEAAAQSRSQYGHHGAPPRGYYNPPQANAQRGRYSLYEASKGGGNVPMPVPEDPSDPAWHGQCCGVARLRLTLVDMSDMDKKKGQGQQLARQSEGSPWDFMPRDLQNGLPALFGLTGGTPDSSATRANRACS